MFGHSDPVIFFCYPQYGSNVYVRAKNTATSQALLGQLEKVFKKYNPAYPFTYSFVDDQFNMQFKTEMLISVLSRLFATLAIIISCLGLFGLAAYTAERRTREIGIRKVLGASIPGIAGMLSKDFLQLVFISCLVAFPVAWWLTNRWLRDYEYRVGVAWWIFIAAGTGAILIATITVSFQAVRAAIANPVKSLRTE
jgi:ABC-type antimicrobial peptide transport system permease subunit